MCENMVRIQTFHWHYPTDIVKFRRPQTNTKPSGEGVAWTYVQLSSIFGFARRKSAEVGKTSLLLQLKYRENALPDSIISLVENDDDFYKLV